VYIFSPITRASVQLDVLLYQTRSAVHHALAQRIHEMAMQAGGVGIFAQRRRIGDGRAVRRVTAASCIVCTKR
jgi:hypothetical protein